MDAEMTMMAELYRMYGKPTLTQTIEMWPLNKRELFAKTYGLADNEANTIIKAVIDFSESE